MNKIEVQPIRRLKRTVRFHELSLKERKRIFKQVLNKRKNGQRQ